MGDIPQVMKASVLLEVGKIAVEERPVPIPDPDQVLIKVDSVGVCGSDVHYYDHGRIGDYVVESPLILGHEASGIVVAAGADVDPGRVGERVSIEPQRCCRTCAYCKSGRYNLCPSIEFYATPPVDGAFCEYVTIQDDFAFAVPDSISMEAAALMEPLSVGIAAAQKADIRVGDSVLIAGGGPIGIITAQVARAFGAAEVTVTDLSPERREMALRFGATASYDPRSAEYERVRADKFIDATGATSAIQDGLARTNAGGIVVLVGSADIVPLSVPDIAMREVSVTGIFRYTGTWPIAIELVKSGKVDLDSLVTDVFGLEQVEEALTADSSPTALKRIVKPGVARV